ncbi:MAG TPA: ABC transporter permease [bacterium]|nr:ABC transporter permease [bacterium]
MRAARLLTLILTVLMTATIAFVLLRVVPGDPAALMLGLDAPPAELAVLRHQLGEDQPIWAQYAAWLGGLATGHLGTSFQYHAPVATLIAERLPVTLSLAAAAMVVTVVVALPLGLLAAVRAWSPLDLGVLAATQLGLAVPNFWLGILLLLAFSVSLRWFPLQGYAPLHAGVAAWAGHLVLPAVTLGAARAAQLMRFVRGAALEELGREYVRTARGKGLGGRAVLLGHVLRNALIPVVTVAGLQIGFLLGGAIIVEQVFGLPGIGRLVLQGIFARDLPVVQGAVVVLAAFVCVLNAVVDLLYGVLDPRVSVE